MAGTGSVGTVRVRGLRELNLALKSYESDVRKGLRKELRVVAEPVKQLATELALGNITNMTAHWARMRLGVTAKSVYIVPSSRRAGGSPRPNLTELMLTRAMEPALEERADDVIDGLERMLDGVAARNGFL